VLLSLKYKFLFVHIAKTGGTSVRASLTRLRWRDPNNLVMMLCSRISHLYGHRIGIKFPRHAKVIAAHEMLPRDFFDSLYKFSFVRNPWDLQVSSYHHIRRERPHVLEGCENFNAFLERKLDPDRPWNYHLDNSIQRQTDCLVDMDGKLLVDFVGRYENLQEDFDTVCQRIGVARRELPHRRRATDRSDYRNYYNDRTAALIAEYFSDDIKRFGYRFE
jgi:hypothetical protein